MRKCQAHGLNSYVKRVINGVTVFMFDSSLGHRWEWTRAGRHSVYTLAPIDGHGERNGSSAHNKRRNGM
jgi:hypothetical protein